MSISPTAMGSHRVWGSLGVYAGFVATTTLLLLLSPARSIHDEELDYGELPVALLDGLVTLDNLAQFQTFAREGAMLVLAPFVAVIFRLLGPSLFALKIAAVLLSGLWAVVWFRVSRLAYPRIHPVLAAAAFVVPLPLVQVSSLTATSIMTHLGSSLWHGLSLLAVLAGGRRPAGAVASGLFCGIGMYCGYSIAPLIPGLLWTGWRIGGESLWKYWLGGFVPPLLVAAQFAPSASFSDVGMRLSPHGRYFSELARDIIEYGAGIYAPTDDTSGAIPVFSSLALAYPLLLAGIAFALWWSRQAEKSREDATGRAVSEGLAASSLGLLMALWVTRYPLETSSSDGLRYLLPLAAPFTLAFVAAACRLRREAASIAVSAFVLLNLAAYSWLVTRSGDGRFLHLIKGYRGSFFLHVDGSRSLRQLPQARRADYAMWVGAADAIEGRADQEIGVSDSSGVPDEYWRGVGLGAATMDPACLKRETCAAGLPSAVRSLVWQGAGASRHCSEWPLLRTQVPDAYRDDVLWGSARGSFHDCEPWPGGAVATSGAAHGLAARLALPGRGDELLAVHDEGFLPPFSSPPLSALLERLASKRRSSR